MGNLENMEILDGGGVISCQMTLPAKQSVNRV